MGATVVCIFMLVSPSLAFDLGGLDAGDLDAGDLDAGALGAGAQAGGIPSDSTNLTGGAENPNAGNEAALEQFAINHVTAGYVGKCPNGEEQIRKTVTEVFKLAKMLGGNETCDATLATKKSEVCEQYKIATASGTVLEDTDCGDGNPNLEADAIFEQLLVQSPCKHADLEEKCSASDEVVSTAGQVDDGGNDDDQSDDDDESDDEESDAGGKGGSDADAKAGSSSQYQAASLLLVFSLMLAHSARVLCL